MIKGNLLLESETFRLTDDEVPLFVERMEALQTLLVDYIDEYGYDSIYGNGYLGMLQFKEYMFYELGFIELHILQKIIPGFSNDIQKAIIRLIGHDDKYSHSLSVSFCEFDAEFNGNNNGLLGLQCDRFSCPSKCAVYSEESWYRWKTDYLTKHPQHIDWKSSNHLYLPNLAYSNLLLGLENRSRFGGKDHTDFYAKAGKMAGGDMIALSLEVGRIIAEANFYQYDDRVSRLNNNSGQIRDIYSLNVIRAASIPINRHS